MKIGQTIKFCRWTHKAISNYEIALEGRLGTVLEIGPEYLQIKLCEHEPELDSWDNILTWTIEDLLHDCDGWDLCNNLERTQFFRGCLASLITQESGLLAPARRMTVSDGENMSFELTEAFHSALKIARTTEEGSDENVAATCHAFRVAHSYGWDNMEDKEFAEWALKATEQECLAEGLRQALKKCQPSALIAHVDGFLGAAFESVVAEPMEEGISHEIEGRAISAATDAQDVFWASIVKSFPEVITGDFDPGATCAFDAAIKDAVTTWLGWNHPDLPEDAIMEWK
jgi:hypothetical protein